MRHPKRILGTAQSALARTIAGDEAQWRIDTVISSSTALDLSKYLSEHANEVNIMAIGYGDAANAVIPEGAITPFADSRFYSGKIGGSTNAADHGAGFVDIIKLGASPPIEALWRTLFLKQPKGLIST
jgi:hypothetical protein